MSGVIITYFFLYVMALGHSINVLKQTQHSCALMFTTSEQGLQEILQLKYLAMAEAKRSEQNIISQKYIDQMNVESIKKSVMRNYVRTFPESYIHVLEYSSWVELEDYVNKAVQKNKEQK
jgi:flagellar motor component MotA